VEYKVQNLNVKIAIRIRAFTFTNLELKRLKKRYEGEYLVFLYDIFVIFIYERYSGILVNVKHDNENTNCLKSLNTASFTRT
jgi:hypothetical protein